MVCSNPDVMTGSMKMPNQHERNETESIVSLYPKEELAQFLEPSKPVN